ncbi:GNAT family N-acetyltransferase [Streptomyces sp. NBC_01304]|uniref:GNAT family N-acetyltransferase n=1 Tax=Streptomyces sp. NBC_01304 TaxID=2903818 RepID=UPI002E0E5F8B|nr:GNAT family N-acetyltransferase [Streptomyces sp. NBC_01304]
MAGVLSLAEIAADPGLLTWRLRLPAGERGGAAEVILRPLVHGDADGLGDFLAGLSPTTRRLSTFDGYDLPAARELCAAIGRYDKLRLVLEEAPGGRIVGLLEFSLDLTAADIARHARAGIRLDPATDCRFGPTLADDHQANGVGSLVFPLLVEVARRLGRTRIILWGGVLADNARALRFYEKNGFRRVGSFTGPDGTLCLDMLLDPNLGRADTGL